MFNFLNIIMQNKKSTDRLDIFLISAALLTISAFFYVQYCFFADVNNAKNATVARTKGSELLLETDKVKYSSNEPVRIAIKNISVKSFSEAGNDDSVPIESRQNLGNNYAIGMIEKNENNKWIAVEPIWRCEERCFDSCGLDLDSVIKAYESKIFVWDQKLLNCGHDIEEEVVRAESGIYRATIAARKENSDQYELIHSKVFSLEID
jgi:hypothetical protein